MNCLKVLVCLVLASVVISCSDSKTASNHIEQAKSYANESKFDEGIIELKNAIKKEPDNAEARFLLGKTYLEQGSGFEAVKELEKANKLKYLSHKTIPLLARSYMLVNSNDEIIELDEQASQLPVEIKVQYLAYKTLAGIRIGNIEAAKESERLANDLSGSNTFSLLASAYLYLAENKLELANSKIITLLVSAPENPDALILKGKIDTALGNHGEAIVSYLSYAKIQPKSSVVTLFLADAYLNEQKYNEAGMYADNILAKIPNQPFAHYVKAVVDLEYKNYQAASKHAEQALLADFNTPHLRLVAGASAYYQSNFEQSYFHLNLIIKYLPAEHPAKKMFAISQLQLGLVSEVAETLSDFTVDSEMDAQFLSTLSFQLAEIGAIDDAKALATQATASNNSATAEEQTRSGILKLMLNDPTGVKNLEKAIALKPGMLEAELALVTVAIKNNQFEKAKQIADKWREEYPDKPLSYNVMASVHLKEGKLDLAKIALNKSLALQPKNFFAISELIKLNMNAGNVAEANKLSEQLKSLFPNNVNVLKLHYAVSRVDPVKRDQALIIIKSLYESDPDNIKFGGLYAEVLLDTKKYKASTKVLNSYPVSIKLPKKFWQLKVYAQRNVNNGEPLLTLLENWTKTNPYHTEPILLLADFHIKDKNANKALNVIELALTEQKANQTLLKIAKMQMLLDSKKLSQAKRFYSDFIKDEMNENIADGMQGRILLIENKFTQAEPLLASFYNNFPSSQSAILFAVAQKGSGKTNDAIATLKLFLQKNKADNKVRSLLANYHLEKDPEAAIPLYEQMLPSQPNNIVVLNNLAWLNLDANNLEKALEHSKRAIALAPEHPNVIDTRGMVLLKSGDKVGAWKTIIKAYNLTKGRDLSIALNYAEVLIANSKNDDALITLRSIKSDKPEIIKRKKDLSTLANKKALK